MFRRSQTDTDGHHENSNNLNPQNNYSCSLMSHSKNTVCTTPMRSSFRRYFHNCDIHYNNSFVFLDTSWQILGIHLH